MDSLPTPNDMPARILAAAEMLLRRHGPEKVTVVDIARTLGMSHANIYRHFASKAALRAAVAEAWLSRISGPLDAIARGPGSGAGRMTAWLRALAALKRDRVRNDPELFAALHKVALDSPEVVERHIGTLRGQMAFILAAGDRDGSLPCVGDAKAQASAVLDATIRFYHPDMVCHFGDDVTEEEALDRVIRLLLAGLGAKT